MQNVELKEFYLIAILEFKFKDSNAGSYFHNVALTNTDSHEIFYNKLGFKFLELPKFVKTEAELVTDLDRWFYMLKHMSHLERMPTVLDKRIFQKVFKIAEVSNLTKEEKEMYDSSLKAKWDYENSLAYSEARGEEKKSYTVVENLIVTFGFTDEQAAKAAEVSIDLVKKVRAGLAETNG